MLATTAASPVAAQYHAMTYTIPKSQIHTMHATSNTHTDMQQQPTCLAQLAAADPCLVRKRHQHPPSCPPRHASLPADLPTPLIKHHLLP
jgi:hypothetical protein